MNQAAYGKRSQEAVNRIGELTGFDLSRAALPKAHSAEIFRLFQLEAIADQLPGFIDEMGCTCEPRDTVFDEAIEAIAGIKGFGDSTMEKIKEAIDKIR